MGIDLGSIYASVGLKTTALKAGILEAKGMMSGLDASMSTAATGGVKKAENALTRLGSKILSLPGPTGKAGGAISNLGTTMGGASGPILASAVAIGGLVFGMIACARAAEEVQKIDAQTNAVIESTGGVANVSAAHVGVLADKLRDISGVDDEVVKSGENILLTFRGIQNVGEDKIFDQATESTLDMSIALGKDLNDSAIKVGKALQDPVKGLTALRRYGVAFTDEQANMIKQMVATNDVIGAQKVILAELNAEFGGSAAAAGQTLAGQMAIAKSKFHDLVEEAGKAFLPALTGGLKSLSGALGVLSAMKIPAILSYLANPFTMLAGVERLGKAIGGLFGGNVHQQANMTQKDFDSLKAKIKEAQAAGVNFGNFKLTGVKKQVDDLTASWKKEMKAADEAVADLEGAITDLTKHLAVGGLAKVTQDDIGQMVGSLESAVPEVRDEGYKMMQALMDSVARSSPVIRDNMSTIMDNIRMAIEQVPAGQMTDAKMAEIINGVLAAIPGASEAAGGITAAIAAYFAANPTHPKVGEPEETSDPINFAQQVINKMDWFFRSNPSHPVVGTPVTTLSPTRSWPSGEAAGAYVASKVQAGIDSAVPKITPMITGVSGLGASAAKQPSILKEIADAYSLVGKSFGNFKADMDSEPFREVEEAIMRMTVNNASSLGDWRNIRKAYDDATKSLADYEKKIKAGEAAIESLQKKIDAANAARERPSLVMGKEQSELQLKIMQAEDAHNYALAAQLTIQKDALDRKKEELDLTTQIADQTKELKDTSAFAGKTTAQIDAMIAKWTADLLKKESQVAALKVSYEKVQASVDKFKSIIDDLASYFTSKSPPPSYQSGTSYVPRTGMALVHKGERITPANLNPIKASGGATYIIDSPLYLDGKVITGVVTKIQGANASAYRRSGARY